jgi:two-component system LytT family sensor kinase
VIRFGDKLRFETDVAARYLDMLVPSMMLQPLVENSIKHGLSSKVEGGTIRIRTHRTETRLHLLVEDDGVGISEEKLGTLLEHGGIGVSNVNERLKVLFGAEYRMWIESQPGMARGCRLKCPSCKPIWRRFHESPSNQRRNLFEYQSAETVGVQARSSTPIAGTPPANGR